MCDVVDGEPCSPKIKQVKVLTTAPGGCLSCRLSDAGNGEAKIDDLAVGHPQMSTLSAKGRMAR
jgi:hypothetical protein